MDGMHASKLDDDEERRDSNGLSACGAAFLLSSLSRRMRDLHFPCWDEPAHKVRFFSFAFSSLAVPEASSSFFLFLSNDKLCFSPFFFSVSLLAIQSSCLFFSCFSSFLLIIAFVSLSLPTLFGSFSSCCHKRGTGLTSCGEMA